MDTRKPMRTLHYACVLGLRDHKKLENQKNRTCDQSYIMSKCISVSEFAKKLENKNPS